ncbi:MAG: hypothetical protein IPK19_18670 [Chloroflexi bacterium]|nr:hypothetical protein [Chloroflexota bacterium]
MSELVNEVYQRLYVGTTVNTADKETEERFFAYLSLWRPASVADQRLKQKLLASGAGARICHHPARLRAANSSARERPADGRRELTNEFDKIIGAQTVGREGEESAPFRR